MFCQNGISERCFFYQIFFAETIYLEKILVCQALILFFFFAGVLGQSALSIARLFPEDAILGK